MKLRFIFLAGTAALALACLYGVTRKENPARREIWTQDAYVWQRTWTGDVASGVAAVGDAKGLDQRRLLNGLAILQAEIAWPAAQVGALRAPLLNDHPRIAWVQPNWFALRQSGCPIALTLRVGPRAELMGDGSPAGEAALKVVIETCDRMLAAARVGGAPDVTELQIDFDAATRQLPDYALWIDRLRVHLVPLPITVTALPSWLGRPGFRQLVEAADGFVLQVHSLESPRIDRPASLLAPAHALEWAREASGYGRPFRVALPTYGYQVGFAQDGRCLGIRAEQATVDSWPIQREVESDAKEMEALARELRESQLPSLQGVIWYRLPVASDRRNWTNATFYAVLRGDLLGDELHIQVTEVDAHLREIWIENHGNLAASWPSRLRVNTKDDSALTAWPVAADVLPPYECTTSASDEMVLRLQQEEASGGLHMQKLRPGERRCVAWMRFSDVAPHLVSEITKNSAPLAQTTSASFPTPIPRSLP